MKKIIFSQQDTQNIIELYQSNQTLKEIGNKYNVCRTVIKRILEENNIKLRTKTTKYYADYDIFETIDTSEKAYWLGYIAADGCNYQREENASILIQVAQKDIGHLEKFKKFCNTNAEIKSYISNSGFSNNTPMCKIVLNSVKMSADLENKGIVPKKSLILKPPIIDEKFYLPFILGYFDGDGSISKTSQYNNYSLSLVGTKEILEWINSILQISNSLEKRQDNDKNNYYIRCGGTNKPYNILKQLYDSCEIHLDRKYEIFTSLRTVVLNGNIK